MMITVILYVLMALIIASALTILFTKNVLYAAFSLMALLLGVAGIYVLLGAEFVAISQIMIYVGGIVVLMIFGVMLTNKLNMKVLASGSQNWFIGMLTSAVLLYILLQAQMTVSLKVTEPVTTENNVEVIGKGLLTTHLLPFEISAILLLIALIGATSIAYNKKENNAN